ncbi:MAG: PspC domain-containing protein [Candidatus Kapabacteria bacterium]|jgi:phage shock protein C|nr:PspC domain-containing protein [Candidatus Kapabacteria bacterium]
MQKRLYRSQLDKKIGGVCGGLGEYFNVDPVIVRALFAIAFFAYGTGFLAYIVLWIIVPAGYYQSKFDSNSEYGKTAQAENSPGEDSFNPASNNKSERKSNDPNHFIGIALIVVGGIWVINNLVPNFDFDFIFPVLLLGLGILLLTRGMGKHNKGDQL